MSEIKISCPSCGQHIACGAEWAGRQVSCPTCQKPLLIPAPVASALPPAPAPLPPAPAPMRTAPPPPAAIPPPRAPGPAPAAAPGAPGATKKTSGLAIASLVCSIFGLCPLSSIAGIICGHLAKGRLRRDSTLKGNGLATAGLCVGYAWVLLTIASLVIQGPGMFREIQEGIDQAKKRQAELNRPASPPPTEPTPRPARPARPRPGTPPAPERTTPRPARPPGTSASATPQATPPPTAPRNPFGEPKLERPADPVTGKVGPTDFNYDHAVLMGGWLTLRQGENATSDAEVVITLFAQNAALEGKTIRVAPGVRAGTTPHIRAKWMVDGAQNTEIVMNDYTMTLTFGKIQDGQLPGSIELELPGKADTRIKGNFNATVK